MSKYPLYKRIIWRLRGKSQHFRVLVNTRWSDLKVGDFVRAGLLGIYRVQEIDKSYPEYKYWARNIYRYHRNSFYYIINLQTIGDKVIIPLEEYWD